MEQLIQELNSRANQGQPHKIDAIQRQIQQLQSGSAAWQTSLDLLNTNDDTLRFYGALTLGLKINADWDKDSIGVDRANVARLLEQLISRYIALASTRCSNAVLSKLASTLGALFSKGDAAWALPCRHVLACFLAEHYVRQDQAPSISDILLADVKISSEAFSAVLLLAQAIHDEVDIEGGDQISHRAEIRLSNNALDIWHLINFGLCKFMQYQNSYTASLHHHKAEFVATSTDLMAFVEAVTQLIPLWVRFVDEEKEEPFELTKLFNQSASAITSMLNQVPDARGSAIACLYSLENKCHALLRRTMPTYISDMVGSQAARGWVQEFLDGDSTPEGLAYLETLDAILINTDLTSPAYATNSLAHQQMLQTLQSLLHCRGMAVVEDEACRPVLDMAISLVEGFSEWAATEPFYLDMKHFVEGCCAAILAKIAFPESELDRSTKTWSSDDYNNFVDFRFDAQDLFQTAYSTLGPSLALQISDTVLSVSWCRFEAALYALTCLADAIADDEIQCDTCLNRVFTSSRWQQAVSE
ncbi:member of the karyopherin-beta, partial [Elasticomyces elasticus]